MQQFATAVLVLSLSMPAAALAKDGASINALKQRVEGRIDTMEERVNVRIDALERGAIVLLDALEHRLNRIEERLQSIVAALGELYQRPNTIEQGAAHRAPSGTAREHSGRESAGHGQADEP